MTIRKECRGKLRPSQKGVGDWQCSCPGWHLASWLAEGLGYRWACPPFRHYHPKHKKPLHHRHFSARGPHSELRWDWGVPSPELGMQGKGSYMEELLGPANLTRAPFWFAYKGLQAGLQRTLAVVSCFLPAVLANLFPEHWWEMRKYRHSPGPRWNDSEPLCDPTPPRQAPPAQFYGWEGSKGSNCSHMGNGPICCV